MYVYIFTSGEEQDLRIRSLYLYHCCSLHYFHHSLASGKTTGREHSPTHQQKIRLKIYWAWPCPTEQYPVSPSVSLSHQEPSINLLPLSVRKSEVPQSWIFVTPLTVAYQAPQSMEFSRQEYWSGLPFPSPGDLPSPGIEPRCPTLQADALPSELPGEPSYLSESIQNESHNHRKLIKPITWTTALSNSVKLLAMPCRAT